jgi:hypothetical protein
MSVLSNNDLTMNLSWNGSIHTYNDSQVQIIEADSKNQMLKLPKQFLYVGCGIVWFLILIGSKFRYILYKYIFDRYKSKELKTIDILTLVVALVEQVSTVLLVLYGTLMVINDTSLQYIAGGSFICSLLMYVIEFGRYYSFIGNLIISVYRILLIKNHRCVSGAARKRNLLKVFLFFGLSLTSLSVVINALNDYEQTRRDNCMLVLPNPMFFILDEYEQSRGNPSILSYWATTRMTINVILLFTVVAEIIIYIIFFHHMYKNDNSQGLRQLLDPRVIRSRNKRNAIPFFGQFCSFIFKFSLTLIWVLTTVIGIRSKGLILARFFIRMVSFPAISILDVLTSTTLRSNVFKFNLYDIIFGLK